MNLDWVIPICVLIATIVGSALGAWIQGRFSEAGRIRAITSHIDQVMTQARERARAEEEGKRIATHEDIENVLREVTLVTKETEQVRTDIASAVWEHQNAWNLRRDMYIQLLSALGNVFVDASKAVWVHERAESAPLNDELIRHARALDEQLQSNQRSLSCIIASSGLVVSAEATRIVETALRKWRLQGSLASSKAYAEFQGSVNQAIFQLQDVARTDLKLPRL